MKANTILDTIGNTPLVRLVRIPGVDNERRGNVILAKLEGNNPAGFPLVKSQHADYLIKTLSDFKSDARSNNPENMMHMIAKKMTLEEIKAVSYDISMMK